MTLTPAYLLQRLESLQTAPSEYLLALSGGLDSTVLLHLLSELREQLPAPIRAVYIDHGLQAPSAQWGEHCQKLCEQRSIPCKIFRVEASADKDQSPEEAARLARYAALANELAEHGVLLTAQHQDDQAETLLLQLLRGAGPRGLAAMPEFTAFANGWQMRPLLQVSRQQIHDYAQRYQLEWIDDPSNADVSFARNYLRHQVMPVLRQRWPAVNETLSRSAIACAEMVQVADAYLLVELQNLLRSEDAALSVAALTDAKAAKGRQLLLAWFRQQGVSSPSRAQLQRIEEDVLRAAEDAEPCVQWGEVQLRRYRGWLYLLPRQLPEVDTTQSWSWNGRSPLELPTGVLSLQEATGEGISAERLEGGKLCVHFRRGGERIVLPGRQRSTSLKQAFQDAGIPPWQRQQLPLVFLDDQLVAVAGMWISQPFAARPEESGLKLNWQPYH